MSGGNCAYCGKPTTRFYLWDAWDNVGDVLDGGTGWDCGCQNAKQTKFGEALRKHRLHNEISIRTAADLMNMTASEYCDYERGKRIATPEIAWEFAVTLGANESYWFELAKEGATS